MRIFEAIKYIEENLDTKLTLTNVSQKAYFSPFHFHRLFKATTHETLNNFINRKRIEKAASYLLYQSSFWCAWWDSNPRPRVYETPALTAELQNFMAYHLKNSRKKV